MNSRRAIFLDRDGTLNRDLGFVHRVEDLELIENVVPALRQLAAAGFQLLITTNQSGIARGHFGEAEMQAFNTALVERLQADEITIAGIYFCPFLADATVPRYRHDSPLRKPAPGMILQAAAEHGLELAECFAIGDKKSDVLAGQAAGCRTVLVRTGKAGVGEEEITARPDFVANDLLDAAQWIVSASGHSPVAL